MVGHEIVGKVIGTGKNVTKYKVGDLVGVGCLVDSCRKCASCREDLENYCERKGCLGARTWALRKKPVVPTCKAVTSSTIVVDEHFVLRTLQFLIYRLLVRSVMRLFLNM